jgi:large conductance mechanosensitive channel
MSFFQEFKRFAVKGNVIDLAVGVIIGGAFSKIVDSLVGDLIMPLVSRVFGGLDFSSYYLPLAGQSFGLPLVEAKKLGAVFAYGSFLTVVINFLLLGMVIFALVRQMNKMMTKEAAAPVAQEPAKVVEPVIPQHQLEEIQLLREIRDELRLVKK